jgi:SAM-dependent methyltransferase
MESAPNGFNYKYLIAKAVALGGRVLDYGCGRGEAVALGLALGVDIWGADAYSGAYSFFATSIVREAQARIGLIDSAGHAPYPDAHFDLIFSNQVIEHVEEPAPVIADIYRLLKPGGVLIAVFPVLETWFEGHVRLYFVHRFAKDSPWRGRYLKLAHRLGFGAHRSDFTAAQWPAAIEKGLDSSCFYRPRRELLGLFEAQFGTPIEELSADYMRMRLGNRMGALPTFADPILSAIYRRRAGEIFQIKKAKNKSRGQAPG